MRELPSVSEVIVERKNTGSKPGNRRDGYKLILSLEGGCMRSVITAGMTVGIGKLGLLRTFDEIMGVSAGAAIGAHLISEQTRAVHTYFTDLNGKNFINVMRIFYGRPILDIPYLTHKVLKEIRPLDWKKVADSDIPLHVMVTSAHDAQTVDFNTFKTQDDLLDALHWSCRIPVVAGWPDNGYADGGVTTGGIALEEALAIPGCTHVLVLQSRPENAEIRTGLSAIDLLGYLILKRDYPLLARATLRVSRVYARTMQKINAARENPGQFNQRIESIQVPVTCGEISFLETDSRQLKRGVRDGYTAVIERFDPFW